MPIFSPSVTWICWRKKIKMMHSINQAVLIELCKHETSSEGWLFRHHMQTSLASHQRLPRPTWSWRKRSSVNLTYPNTSSRCQNSSWTCGWPWTLKMNSSRKYSSWLERFIQSSKIQHLQFPISTAFSQEDRLMVSPDSTKWFWRQQRLTGQNHRNMPG